MPISIARADQHIAEWQRKLSPFASRTGWASSLFHACQIEVAAAILRAGEVICRSQVGHLLCDVANQGALWNNPAAHNYVRLYFRPRNSFHLKTEGIKSRSDPHRVDPHMSIPVMLVFDLRSVLTMAGSGFVAGNFAGANLAPLTGDAAYDGINFSQVYHDSSVSRDEIQNIHNARMSEVVIPHRLNLQHLSYIVTRTIYEERYLKALLGDEAHRYNFAVEKSGSVFFRWGIYIKELYTQDGQIYFDFKSPSYGLKLAYDVVISCGQQRQEYQLAPRRWRVMEIVNHDPNAIWQIEIEGCVAYRGVVPVAGSVLM